MQYWQAWRYKNITLCVLFVFITIFLVRVPFVKEFFLHLGTLGYVGAFFAGILFVSTFTVSIGVIILTLLTRTISPFEIGFIAGLGGVVGDLIIFHFFKTKLASEIKYLFKKYANRQLLHLFHTRYFAWTLPVFGAIVIASPLPDELGVSLVGLSKMNSWQFAIFSFVLNFVGIFAVVAISSQIF